MTVRPVLFAILEAIFEDRASPKGISNEEKSQFGKPSLRTSGREVYFPVGGTETQWSFDPDHAAAFDAFIAPYGLMPAYLAASQEMDTDRLTRLLDRIGTAIVVTHSASGPDRWLVADLCPGLVVAIVTVEPMPLFGSTTGIGSLDNGACNSLSEKRRRVTSITLTRYLL